MGPLRACVVLLGATEPVLGSWTPSFRAGLTTQHSHRDLGGKAGG